MPLNGSWCNLPPPAPWWFDLCRWCSVAGFNSSNASASARGFARNPEGASSFQIKAIGRNPEGGFDDWRRGFVWLGVHGVELDPSLIQRQAPRAQGLVEMYSTMASTAILLPIKVFSPYLGLECSLIVEQVGKNLSIRLPLSSFSITSICTSRSRTVNGELEPSTILNMSPNELKVVKGNDTDPLLAPYSHSPPTARFPTISSVMTSNLIHLNCPSSLCLFPFLKKIFKSLM